MARKSTREAEFSGYSTSNGQVVMRVTVTTPGPDCGREVLVRFAPAEARDRFGYMLTLADALEPPKDAPATP